VPPARKTQTEGDSVVRRTQPKAAKAVAKTAARAAAAPPPPDTTPELDEPPAGAQGAPAGGGDNPALPDTEAKGAETAGGGDSDTAGHAPPPDNTEGDLVAGAEFLASRLQLAFLSCV
jgi:hypothetical protein